MVSEGQNTFAEVPKHVSTMERVKLYTEMVARSGSSSRGGRTGTLASENMPNATVNPHGSTAFELAGADEGSSKSSVNTRCEKTPLQPKPKSSAEMPGEWAKLIPGILNGAKTLTGKQVLANLMRAGEVLQQRHNTDYWMTDAGQQEILRRIQDQSTPPSAGSSARQGTSAASLISMTSGPKHQQNISTGMHSAHLSSMDYTAASKASLCSASPSTEWIQVELTADTGACDTVMPVDMCESIPIVPSLQSIRELKYEVANGEEIPNLGERRCLMWTEHGSAPLLINMQVANVHKALLSLSRCADMGFEGRFGRSCGALVCEKTGEMIPLERKGNLYVLKAWIRAAPFGRPE